MFVVISDLHFGIEDNAASLSNAETVGKFIEELKTYGKIDKLILLGDVFDLWRAKPPIAFKEARSFFNKISEICAEIVYVIGNHDHHLVIMNQEKEFMEYFTEEGDTKEIVFSANVLLDNFLKKACSQSKITITYPFYTEEINGKNFLFQHGHHLDFFQTLIPRIMTLDITSEIGDALSDLLSKITGKHPQENPYYLDKEKFEILMTHTYENLYQSAFVGEYVALENGLWTIPKTMSAFFGNFKTWSKIIGERKNICTTNRYTKVEEQYRSILNFISKYHSKEHFSCFVYGDTHKAGGFKEDENILAVNSGCWIKEPDKDSWEEKLGIANLEEIPNTYIAIDEEKGEITVRQFENPQPISGPYNIEDLP